MPEHEVSGAKDTVLPDGLVAALPFLAYIFDPETHRILYANRPIEALHGYTQAELEAIGPGSLYRLVHPDDVAVAFQATEHMRSAADGDLVEHEYRFRHKDGSWRWLYGRHLVFQRAATGAPRLVLALVEDITARKEAELGLRWQAELLDQTHEALMVWAPEGQIVFWSRGAANLYGYSQAEAVGQVVHTLLRTRYPQELPLILAQLERGDSWTGELGRVTRDGREVVAASRMVLLRDATGARQVVETNRDISARKAAEVALLAREQRWRFALRAAGMVAWEYDLQTHAIRWSPEAEAFLGFPAGGLGATMDNSLKRVHPDDRATAMTALEDALRDGVYEQDLRLLRPDGTVVWLRGRGEVIYDAAGAPVQMRGISQDITALKASQEALRLSEQRFQVALQGSPIIVFNQDRDLRYTWIHNVPPQMTAARMIGRTDEELLDRPEDAARLTALKGRVLQDGIGRREELSVTAMGATYWVDLTVEPLRAADGQIIGITGAAIDITTRKAAEAERLALIDRERQAHQATETALEQAEQATRERDLLISVAAHDLRTPLTVILAQAQRLSRRAEDEGLSERTHHALEMIADEARRLNQMIEALLDMSRIQEGRLTIKPRPLDLAAVIERISIGLQATLTRHQLSWRGLSSPLMVSADPIRIEQVFVNLLDNAAKYSPAGGTIEIWAERAAGLASVHIRDEGIGIPEEAMPHLFTRFYRAPNAGAQAASSLGVGLFVVRELVQAHAGTITVKSELGQGSTFTVRLPLAETERRGV